MATLEGEVKITQGENQLVGNYAEVDMATGISRLLGAPPGSAQQPTQVKALVLPRATKEETTVARTGGDTQPGEGKATAAEQKEGQPGAGGPRRSANGRLGMACARKRAWTGKR